MHSPAASSSPSDQAETPAKVIALMHASAGQTGSGAFTLDALGSAMRQRGLDAEVIELGPDDDASEAAKRAALGPAEAVVAVGGDGMVHAVARGLWNATREGGRAAFGILPAGTMNNVAASLGVPEDPDAALDGLASSLRAKRYRPLDLARIGDMIFVEEAGFGLLSQLMCIGEGIKQNELPVPAAAAEIGKALTTYQSAPLKLIMDGHVRHFHALHVIICNAPVIAMRMNVAPGARMDDGLLDVVVYSRYHPLQLLTHLALRIGGREIADTQVKRFRARRIQVEPDRDSSFATWPIEVDGEPAGDCGPTGRWRRIEIVALPHALQLAAPAAPPAIVEQPWRTTLRAVASTLKREPSQAQSQSTPSTPSTQPTPSTPSTQPAQPDPSSPAGAVENAVENAVGQVAEPPRRAARRSALIRTFYFVGGALGIALAFAASRSSLLPGDLEITRAVQRTRTPARDRFWRAVAWAGYPRPNALIVALLAGVMWFFRFRLEAVFVLIASAVNALNFTLKRIVRRKRPAAPRVWVRQLINEPSFPSGHVMFYVSAFGFVVAAALANLRPSALRRGVVALGSSLIALVGVSRVYLGAHWPSDVAAGYLYGSLYLGSTLQLYAWAKDRQTRHAYAASQRLNATANELAAMLDPRAQAAEAREAEAAGAGASEAGAGDQSSRGK